MVRRAPRRLIALHGPNAECFRVRFVAAWSISGPNAGLAGRVEIPQRSSLLPY
jgi:hypothetical protein